MNKQIFMLAGIILIITLCACSGKEKQSNFSRLYFTNYDLEISAYMKCSINNNKFEYYKGEIQCNVKILYDNGMIILCKNNKLLFYNGNNKIEVDKNTLNVYIDSEGIHYHSSVPWEE